MLRCRVPFDFSIVGTFNAENDHFITCPAEEFDALYDKLVADYVAAGLEEIQQEKAAAYDAEN